MDTLSAMINALTTGLPVLLLHFVVTLVLLGLGVLCYMAISPFNERALIAQGNIAASMILGGTLIALAIPLAVTLANSEVALDIVLWGAVAMILQLLTLGLAIWLVKGLRPMIEAGNVAVAMGLVGVQIAVALLNAGAMAG